MKKITLLVLLLSVSWMFSTNVNGNQSGTWTVSESPYLVIGDINIPNGQVLTIEAGVVINFQGHYKFTVDGKLIVNGTQDNMVLFTTDDTSTGWAGIRFDTNNQISIFNYCKIEYGIATGNYPDMHGGAVLLKESDAEFYHCVFENNKAIGSGDDGMGGAIYGINTGSETETLTKFVDCTFKGNRSITEGGAIKLTNDGHTEFTRCTFINNNAKYGGGAIMFYSAVDVHFTQCLFYMNSSDNSGGGAIKTLNPTVSLFFTNTTFVYNAAYGSGEGGAIVLDYADAEFVNSIIYGNSQTYGDEINIGTNASAVINYCDVDMPDDATGSNNIDNINPLFENIGTGDFTLQESSPCIDAGIDVGLAFVGDSPDLGCFEYGETALTSDYLKENMLIFPNPSKNNIHIMGMGRLVKISIIDMLGKETIITNFQDNTIDISHFNNGMYLLKVWNSDYKTKTSSIIIK